MSVAMRGICLVTKYVARAARSAGYDSPVAESMNPVLMFGYRIRFAVCFNFSCVVRGRGCPGNCNILFEV